MHPFGGTPICPRCQKPVYAAEQTIGPGRKFYHKPCLTCASCNKRLDSGSLVEHDQEPYCKQCHTKCFGTRDLRQANLPHREDAELPSPNRISPGEVQIPTHTGPARISSPSNVVRKTPSPPLDRSRPLSPPVSPTYLRPTRMLSRQNDSNSVTYSPAVSASPATPSDFDSRYVPKISVGSPPLYGVREIEIEEDSYGLDERDRETDFVRGHQTGSKNEYRAFEVPDRSKGGIPRTIPLRPEHTASLRNMISDHSSPAVSSASTSPASSYTKSPPVIGTTATMTMPLSPLSSGAGISAPIRATSTGTRYGAALTSTFSPKSGGKPMSPTFTGNGYGNVNNRGNLGGGTPLCARCSKPVYFAEQVKASGKTFHKFCLRCTECGTSLDSTKLTEKDGQVMCRSCYRKLHGPQGSGYALLGKAGG